MSEDESMVYGTLSKNIPKSISEIMPELPFGRSKTASILKTLAEKNYVTILGKGKSTRYKI